MREQRGAGDGVFLWDPGVSVIGASRPWFEQQTRDRGLTRHGSAGWARGLRDLLELERTAQTQEVVRFASPEEAQRWCQSAVGTDYLTKVLHRGHLRGLKDGDKHWRHLKGGNPLLTAPSGKQTQDRDYSWELILASLAAAFADDVLLEEPPDVTCTFEGRRFGLAGKILYSKSERRFLDAIKKGAEQLEASRADVGFVVINLVEMFPHGAMFRNFRDGRVSDAVAALEIMAAWVDAFLAPYPVEQWTKHLKGKRKLLSVLMFLPTVLHLEGMAAPVPYYRLHSFEVIGRENEAQSFGIALQTACETVPGFTASTGADRGGA